MASTVPRWKTAIANALAEHEKSVVFQLATIDPTTPVPLVRSHIFRAFLVPSSAPALPLLLTTTDIRTPKVAQLTANPHAQLAWWIEGTQEQYRIAGLAGVVPAPTHALYKHFRENVRDALAGSGLAALEREGFDWETRRREMFRGLSAHMRASWCRPVPGSPLVGGEEEARRWPVRLEEPGEDSDEETRRNWETALGNFALVVVDPTDVDMVELGVVPNRRAKFWRTEKGEWESEAVVP